MNDLIVRVASPLVLAALVYLIWWSKKTSVWHKVVGLSTMALGAVILYFTLERGMQQQDNISGLYAFHLAVGGFFFLLLPATGLIGLLVWMMKKEDDNRRWIAMLHGFVGKGTLWFCLATVAVGIVSRML